MKMNPHSFDIDPMSAIETPRHQRALKAALLQAHASSQGKFISFPSKFMSFFKYVAPMGATATLAVLLAQGNGTNLPTFSNPLVIEQVSAQELVSEVATQIQNLSSAEVEALQERLGVSDLAHVLQDAQVASDLRDLSLDEGTFVGSDGQSYCYAIFNAHMAFVADISPCSALLNDYRPVTYTAPDGATVIMAVTPDLLPIVVMSSDLGDGETSFTFSVGEESAGLNFGIMDLDPALSSEDSLKGMMKEIPSMFNSLMIDEEGEDMEATSLEMTVEDGGMPQVHVEGNSMMGGGTEYGPVQD